MKGDTGSEKKHQMFPPLWQNLQQLWALFIPRQPLDPYNYVLPAEQILPKLTSTCQCSRNSSSRALASSTKNTCDLNVGRREQGRTRHLKKYNMECCRLPRMSMTTRNARACRGSAQANHACVNLYHLCSG